MASAAPRTTRVGGVLETLILDEVGALRPGGLLGSADDGLGLGEGDSHRQTPCGSSEASRAASERRFRGQSDQTSNSGSSGPIIPSLDVTSLRGSPPHAAEFPNDGEGGVAEAMSACTSGMSLVSVFWVVNSAATAVRGGRPGR
jgi:hypothetical protein